MVRMRLAQNKPGSRSSWYRRQHMTLPSTVAPHTMWDKTFRIVRRQRTALLRVHIAGCATQAHIAAGPKAWSPKSVVNPHRHKSKVAEGRMLWTHEERRAWCSFRSHSYCTHPR